MIVDCHTIDCDPASYSPTTCACGFTARFIAEERPLAPVGYVPQYNALASLRKGIDMTVWPILRIGGIDIATGEIPEFRALLNVPQPPQHHPEICTWTHVKMAIAQLRVLGVREPAAEWAVLTHDLGKALTPPEMLPKHHGHEEAGVPIVRALSIRLGVPNAWRELAELVCEHHIRCHQIEQAKGPGRRRLLRRLDAYEQRARFELFLACCEADARGRLGLEKRDYPQADILRKALIGKAAT